MTSERFSGNNEVLGQVNQDGCSSPSLDRPQSLSSAIGTDGVPLPVNPTPQHPPECMVPDKVEALEHAQRRLSATVARGVPVLPGGEQG